MSDNWGWYVISLGYDQKMFTIEIGIKTDHSLIK